MNGNKDSSNKPLSKIVSSIVGEPVKVYLEETHSAEKQGMTFKELGQVARPEDYDQRNDLNLTEEEIERENEAWEREVQAQLQEKADEEEKAHTTENSKLDNQEERKRQAAKRLVEHFSNDFMVQMLTLDQYAAIDAIINE